MVPILSKFGSEVSAQNSISSGLTLFCCARLVELNSIAERASRKPSVPDESRSEAGATHGPANAPTHRR